MSNGITRYHAWFLGLLFLLVSCSKHQVSTSVAFYHWKTNVTINELEQSYLDSLNIKYLYVKFFDVDWNETKQQAEPSAEVIWMPEKWHSIQIIPTVFITNRTLKNVSDMEELAHQISRKIERLAKGYLYDEIQIDCDWTISTKEKYAQLLTEIRKNKPKVLLSATIRLHQVKFFEQTGVPPVDRGMLMYYNVGEVDEWSSENSIFEASIAEQYIDRLKEYPIELDVALPLFHWGIVFRDEKLFKIVNALHSNDLLDEKRFEKIGNHRYEVIRNTYLNGHYLYKGDRIRLEFITEDQINIATQQLAEYLPIRNRRVALYHLEEKILKNWSVNALKEGIQALTTQ